MRSKTFDRGATEAIARFVVEIEPSNIPSQAFTNAKRCFIDCLGVMLAGSIQPEGDIVADYVKELAAAPQCSVVGRGFMTAAPLAGLVNGTSAHALDYDDISIKFLAHPSASLLPAILAVGERERSSGIELLTSYIVGFEVGANLGHIMGMKYFGSGWHPSSPLASVAAAAAVCKLLHLNVIQTTMAIGISASLAGGLKAHFGTMTKSLNMGNSARNGIMASMLAHKGFTANNRVVEERNGFLAVFSGSAEKSAEIQQLLGREWFIIKPGVQFKLYPCCGAVTPGIDSILAIREKLEGKLQEIESIECRLSDIASGIMIHQPETGQQAKFSLEYCLAAVVLEGELTLAQFTDEKVRELKIRDLMRKVRVVHPEQLGSRLGLPYEVRVRLRDGKEFQHQTSSPKGDTSNPLTDDELCCKFERCATLLLSSESCKNVLDLLWKLDSLDSVSGLMSLLCGPSGR